MKKPLLWLLALAGLVLGTVVVVRLGAGKIVHAVSRIGFAGLFYVLAWQLGVFVLLGAAWRVVCPGARLGAVIWARLVREGGETCLPLSEIGGLVFGARTLILCGNDGVRATASSVVDVLVEGIGLAPFLLFGLAALLMHRSSAALLVPMAASCGALLIGGVTVFLLRQRVAGIVRKLTVGLIGRFVKNAPERAGEVQSSIEDLFAQRVRVAGASLVHLACWCGGGGNVWIAYHLLGAKPTVADALAIESILSAVLAFGFLVPAGLGVQELTYIGVGRLFGIPAHLSLALSLIRRARDILLGAPALVAWQVLEARGVALGRERSKPLRDRHCRQ